MLGVLPIVEVEGAGDPGAFVVPLAVFGVLMVVIILTGTLWSRAPRTAWFWLVGAIPGVLFILPDIPIIVRGLTSPGSVIEVVIAVAAAGALVVLLVSAVLSFRDALRLAGPAAP